MPQSGQRALSRDIILSTALDLVDEEGLSALFLRPLRERLGVFQTTFYRHFPDGAVLLEGILEQAWHLTLKMFPACADAGTVNVESTPTPEASAPTDGAPTSPLLTYMRAYAHCLASTLHSYPGAVMLLFTHPIPTPKRLSLLARVLVTLARRGFTLNASMLGLVSAMLIYTTAFVAAEVVPPMGGFPEQPADLSAASDALNPEGAQVLCPLIEDLLDDRYDFNAQFERDLEAILRDQV